MRRSVITACLVGGALSPGAWSVAQEVELPAGEPSSTLERLSCKPGALRAAACRDADDGEARPAARRHPARPGRRRNRAQRRQREPVTRARSAQRAPRARAAADASVTIEDFSFQPRSVTVNVGESVTWTNADSAPHSATADDGSFDTGTFEKGQSRAHRFDTAGTYGYYCRPHPGMKGTVRVVAAGNGSPAPDSPAGTQDSGAGDGTSGGAGSDAAREGASGGAAATGGDLPSTGANLGPLAIVALLLLLVGLGVRFPTARP